MSSTVVNEPKRGWLKYVICFGITSIVVFLFMWGRDFFTSVSPLDKVRIASDACFLVGVFTFGVGSLIFVSANGVFDGLVYSLKQFVWLFRVQGIGKKHESFYEYKQRLSEKPKVPVFFMIVIGLFWILAAGVLVYVFYRMEAKPSSYLFNIIVQSII